MRKYFLILLLSVIDLGPCFAQQQSPVVTPRPAPSLPGSNQQVPPTKKANGVCFPPGTPNYNRLKEFIPFVTVEDCLKSGGQLPKK